LAFDDETFLWGQYVNNLMVVQIEPDSNLSSSNNAEKNTDQPNSVVDHNWLGHLHTSRKPLEMRPNTKEKSVTRVV
jgi:hypothetical protein